MNIYIVQKGDTLWKIAKKFGVGFEQLKRLNMHLANPDYIVPGMEIFLPDEHKTDKGKESVKNESSMLMPSKKEHQVMPPPVPQPKPPQVLHEEVEKMPMQPNFTQEIQFMPQMHQMHIPMPMPMPMPMPYPQPMPMPQMQPMPQPMPQPKPQPMPEHKPQSKPEKPQMKPETKPQPMPELKPQPQPMPMPMPMPMPQVQPMQCNCMQQPQMMSCNCQKQWVQPMPCMPIMPCHCHHHHMMPHHCDHQMMPYDQQMMSYHWDHQMMPYSQDQQMMSFNWDHQMMPYHHDHHMMPQHWGEDCKCSRCASKEQIHAQYYEQIKQMEQGGAHCMPNRPTPYGN